tara:strand:+ start:15061 stop:15543 length:483 start_codon:yes stop_codon:yes gene_type:complete
LNKLTLRHNQFSEIIELHFKNDDLSNYLSTFLKPNTRTWDKKEKCWVIVPEVLGEVIAYSRHLFTEINASSLPVNLQNKVHKALQGDYKSDYSTPKNKEYSIEKDTSPYSILYLKSNAPEFVVKAVYKTLAFKYHPDRGGETEQFQKVKEAYEAIMKDIS